MSNWTGLFYLGCFFLMILAALGVMWHKIPTNWAGTIGLSLIAIVAGANAADWFNSWVPQVSFQRVVIFYIGLLFVCLWLTSKPWQKLYEEHWSQQARDRRRRLDRRKYDCKVGVKPGYPLPKDLDADDP